MLKEFKEFAVRGNVVDLATGVIIGAAFGKIVTSVVNDLVMPVVGMAAGKLDFSNLFIALDGKSYKTLEVAKAAGAATINYGLFLSNVLDFLIVAFCIFLIVKQINRFKAKTAEKPAATKTCPFCQSSIHIKAVRCPFCTSLQEEEGKQE